MPVRDYRPEDFESLKKIHEQGGLDYNFPNIETPLFFVKKVMEIEGKVVGAVLWRMEAETYLLLDKESGLTPQENMEVLRELQAEGLNELWMQGIDNCVAWIPKGVEKYFSKRLLQLGWNKDREGWHTWSRETSPK